MRTELINNCRDCGREIPLGQHYCGGGRCYESPSHKKPTLHDKRRTSNKNLLRRLENAC